MRACRKCLSQTTEMSGLNDSCRWTEFLNLFQMPEALSRTVYAHFPDFTNPDETYVQASKNKTHAQVMLHSDVLPTLTADRKS
jgi:hypothetical protein